jgi:hypothetical protein
VRSRARGCGIGSNTCAIEDYEWDYGQVQSQTLPRTRPEVHLSQELPNQYPDQNENNHYTTAPAGHSTSVEGITQGIAQTNLGSSSSSIQQPTVKAPWGPSPSAPSNYIKTRNPSTDREAFDPRECQVALLYFGDPCPDIW